MLIIDESQDGRRALEPIKANIDATEDLQGFDKTHGDNDIITNIAVSKCTIFSLYASHALFMWNHRSYEFASVLFTASAFPTTLLAASIRGLSAHLASLMFSPAVGSWCSQHTSRLKPVQVCVLLQRASISVACLGWMSLIQIDIGHSRLTPTIESNHARLALFALLVVLGTVERLSAVGNIILVERDWLPLLAPTASERQRLLGATTSPKSQNGQHIVNEGFRHDAADTLTLHVLNAIMKRIDLVTKLIAPLAISGIAIYTQALQWTALIMIATQITSASIELRLISVVWSGCPALRTPKALTVIAATSTQNQYSRETTSRQLTKWLQSFRSYLGNPACLPSLAYALEPFSVLTLAGSMSAYLLIARFPLSQITAARAAGTGVEMLSTVLTPMLVSWFSRRTSPGPANDELRALTQVGLLGLGWQLLTLTPALVLLLAIPSVVRSSTSLSLSSWSLTLILFASLALSRLGPFAYSLVSQQIIQTAVPATERIEFSGVEMALADSAELARWGLLGVLGRPETFKWMALASYVSVGVSSGAFAVWVGRRREETF